MSGKRKDRLDTNDLLYRTIIQRYGSVATFCQTHKLHNYSVGELINLKTSPLSKKGRWKKIPLKVADFLSITPEELYPLKIYGLIAEQCAKEQTFGSLSFSDWRQVQNFTYSEEREISLGIAEILTPVEKAIETFSPREAAILKLKFGLNDEHREYTNEEIGAMYDISGSRVGDILRKLIRRLRHPARFDSQTRQTLKDYWGKIRRLEDQRIFP